MIINFVVCHGAGVYCIILHSFEIKMKFLQDSRWLYYNFNAVLAKDFQCSCIYLFGFVWYLAVFGKLLLCSYIIITGIVDSNTSKAEQSGCK